MYWEWFCSIPGIYRTQQELLLRCFGSPKGVYESSKEELGVWKKRGCAWIDRIETYRNESALEETAYNRGKKGIHFISHEHPEYPGRLLPLRDHPYGLFYFGKLPAERKRTAAVIGARMCTPAGKQTAVQIAEAIVRAGGEVVSGAAYGIDGAAQWAALERGGNSFAILGCGVDVCYPASHRRLLERMKEQGGILSEFPPGTLVRPYHFPMRNRIISGLSDTVIVVEARRKSGSLITAGFAAEQGRQVIAVPGRMADELSEGCNDLISNGAEIALSVESIIKHIFPDYSVKGKELTKDIALAPAEKLVYSILGLQTKSLWELEECTALPLSDLSDSLISLELKGLIRETERNFYAKVR